MHRPARILALAIPILVVLSPGIAALAGLMTAPGVLHPMNLNPERLEQTEQMLERTGARKQDFDVRAFDGVELRGWKIRPRAPNGDWVLLFHGVSDNRSGVLGQAEFLLRHGYSVVMMDSRAHGKSGGEMATYGWKERYDTVAVTNGLYATEHVAHLFALGVSMGGVVALQSAAVEPRIEAVVAEDPFANLREVSYDYAGLDVSPLLGKTLFRPAVLVAMHAIEKEGGLDPDNVSPEKAVAERAFPVLLICGTEDHRIPCRHAERIYAAATGSKQLWVVRGAGHATALGYAPPEYERRVIDFFANVSANRAQTGPVSGPTAAGQKRAGWKPALHKLRAGGGVVAGAEIPEEDGEGQEHGCDHGHKSRVVGRNRAAQHAHTGIKRGESEGNDPA